MKNKTLILAARKILKNLLYQCTPEQQNLFKLIYAQQNTDITIEAAVNNMEVYKIDWAISQTEHTIKGNKAKNNVKTYD